jgi:hypothetical protein
MTALEAVRAVCVLSDIPMYLLMAPPCIYKVALLESKFYGFDGLMSPARSSAKSSESTALMTI